MGVARHMHGGGMGPEYPVRSLLETIIMILLFLFFAVIGLSCVAII